MKKLVIFDFDGTLVNTLVELKFLMDQVLIKHGFPQLTLDEYKEAVNGNIDELISNILRDKNSADNIKKVKESYLKLCQIPHETKATPFDGIYDLLLKLQENNILLAINSNRYTESIKYYTNKFFKDVDFVDIQGHAPPNPSKPDAYGINEILKKTSKDKRDTLYIGDSQTDIQTAKNADVDCLIVNWGYSSPDEIMDDYVIDVVDDANKIIQLLLRN